MSILYIAELPDFMGYGIQATGLTENEALEAVKRVHDSSSPENTFEQNWDYFGGRVNEVVLGRAYFGGFGEA